MRITGGKTGGKKLIFPAGSKERPTSDFLRETLFNLTGSVEKKSFLDLYAGSGSVGLEAASRGAGKVFFAEKNVRLASVIKQNIRNCGFEKHCRVFIGDIGICLKEICTKEHDIDLIFADPPYCRGLIGKTVGLLNKYNFIRRGCLIIIQHSIKETFDDSLTDGVHISDQRKYGENALTFLEMETT